LFLRSAPPPLANAAKSPQTRAAAVASLSCLSTRARLPDPLPATRARLPDPLPATRARLPDPLPVPV